MTASAAQRPTSWWLAMLRRRAERMLQEPVEFAPAIAWRSPAEQRAAIRFFNAAFRAEESGLRQAHELARELAAVDPELAEALTLYGDEEGWHRELLTDFLSFLGGEITPMGRVTGLLYRLYGRAERMESIVLTNLMFETIGSTTYRLALGRVRHPAARRMLTILTRDESFHVPLNVHFLRRILARRPAHARRRLWLIHRLLFLSLLALPLASRPKAQEFDGIGKLELSRAYARALAALFAREPDLGLSPPALVLFLLGIRDRDFAALETAVPTSVEAAERAAERENVAVTAL
jgi:hypothetical protein